MTRETGEETRRGEGLARKLQTVNNMELFFVLFAAFVSLRTITNWELCLFFPAFLSPWEGMKCRGRRERRKGNGSQGREGLKRPGFGHGDGHGDGDGDDDGDGDGVMFINHRLIVRREAEGLSLRL